MFTKNYFIENFKINTDKIIYTHIDKNGRNWVKGAYYPMNIFLQYGMDCSYTQKIFQYINSNELNIVENVLT